MADKEGLHAGLVRELVRKPHGDAGGVRDLLERCPVMVNVA